MEFFILDKSEHHKLCAGFQLKPGDRLFYACDGYWDFVRESETVNEIAKSAFAPGVNFAKQSAKFAIEKKKSNDNVTCLDIAVS